MGTLNKKLYIKKTGGTAVACNIYDSLDAAGGKALRVMVDGTAGYVALKTVDDSNATGGRVNLNGTTYAIATQHVSSISIPYTEKSWKTAGTYSFTMPEGVTRLRVALCSGGAGKGGWSAGTSGGDTTAFGITVTGGEGGSAFSYGYGGKPNGYNSKGNKFTDGFNVSFDKTYGAYGCGGNYGGSGGFDSQYVTVTPGQSYSIVVGRAGGTNATCGFVLIGYGGDI